MNEDSALPSQPSFGTRLKALILGFLRFLLRALVLLGTLALLFFALFYGAPFVYEKLILPAEQNALRIDELQATQAKGDALSATSLATMQVRLATLEARSQQDTALMATLQAQVSEAGAALQDAKTGMAGSQSRLDAIDAALARIDAALERLTSTQTASQGSIQSLVDQSSREDPQTAALRRDLALLKAMELITRSRVYLVQNNLGLAREDVQTARDLLYGMNSQVLIYQQQALAQMVMRLDLALGNLPAYPVLAAEDLEVAWRLIVQGLPGDPSLTPSPTPTLAPSATPTILPSATPTAIPATPTITSTLPTATIVPLQAITPTGSTPYP